MREIQIEEYLVFYTFLFLGFSYALVYLMDFFEQPSIPKGLQSKAKKIQEGRVPTNVRNILKARVPGFLEHYNLVPGRMSCHVRPHIANKENIFAYVIGFKETAQSKPDRFITIPVYKNGNLYEH